ncbi:MAG: helix-turn-helix domain-containing protein, partial [Anaeroplasmataceae bacterium]|nr:helix-turn-helix domain-containing protein [Anaeroplasmataceae bacterium]
AYINQVFKITKGHITNKRKTEIYGPKDYLFLNQIFYNPYTLDEYYALDMVAGEWIDKEQIDMSYFPILSKMYQEKKNQVELLLIQDTITKTARYLYFEYQNNKTLSFYLTLNMSELAEYLNLTKSELTEALKYLTSRGIISKHNKLFNILNEKSLSNIAFIPD